MVGDESFLLALNATEHSLYAAETAWFLAKRTGAKVVPFHVVDTHGALHFFGPGKAGLTGSGVLVRAYEQLCDSLANIAEKITESYEARARGCGVAGDMLVGEGDPAEEILKRGGAHSLIVVGYGAPQLVSGSSAPGVRFSVADRIAHHCSRPLLLVRRPLSAVSEVTAVVSINHVNEIWLKNCLSMAQQLRVPFTISLLPPGQGDSSPSSFVKQLQDSDHALGQVKVRVLRPEEVASNFGQEFSFEEKAHVSQVLPVLPTIQQREGRTTLQGAGPTDFLAAINFDCVMLWPEEFVDAAFPWTGARAAMA